MTPDNQSGGHTGGESAVLVENWTLAEARRTAALDRGGWAVIDQHVENRPYLHGQYLCRQQSVADHCCGVFVPLALTTAVANGDGVLVDRIPVRYFLAVALLLQALTLWMAQALPSVEVAILYGVLLGTMMGLMRTVGAVVWPSYYGRLYLGSIAGFASTILTAASALGPMPMGLARDLLGSYNQALVILAFIPLALSVLSLFLRPPRRAV